jgi:hypothetical protein
MKCFVVFLVLIGIMGTFLLGNQAYGLWIPQSSQELLEESQVIFVGNISSVRTLEFERSTSYDTEENGVAKTVIENYTLPLDEYTVNVEESVKNTQIAEVITVRQPTTSIPGRVLPFEGFEVGDRVLFYIKSFDGTNTYSKESFLIPEQCDSFSVITKPQMIGSDYTMMQNGVEKQDNLTANIPIQFTAKRDMGTLSGASLEYDVFISKQVGKIYKDIVFNQTITADAKPCEWLSVAEWEFTPDAGNYLLNGRVYKAMSNFSISNKFFSVLPETPLKQFKAGIVAENVKCKESLILVTKYGGSPACMKPETVPKIVEREWGISDNWIKISNAKRVLNYELDMGKIISIHAFSEYKNPSLPGETKDTSLKIKLDSEQDGVLEIVLPRNLIDAKIDNRDDDFFVLFDGIETEYQETKTDATRTLIFHFPAKTEMIEILGYGYYNSELRNNEN